MLGGKRAGFCGPGRMATRVWSVQGRKQGPKNGGWALPAWGPEGQTLEYGVSSEGMGPDLRIRQAGQRPIWRGPGIKADGREELSPQKLLVPIKALEVEG